MKFKNEKVSLVSAMDTFFIVFLNIMGIKTNLISGRVIVKTSNK